MYCLITAGADWINKGILLLNSSDWFNLSRPADARPETNTGEVAEWSKAHAWKVCKRQRFEGSNPSFSAS